MKRVACWAPYWRSLCKAHAFNVPQLFEPACVRYITYLIPLFHYYKGEEGQQCHLR